MTDAEKAYLEAVIAGKDVVGELSRLRQAVLAERAGPDMEERWKRGYREFLIARDNWVKLRSSLELPPDFDVNGWQEAVKEEFSR